MSILDNIKSLFGGQVDVKVTEIIDSIISTVKPLLEKVESSDAITNAISGYGSLSEKVKDIVTKLGSAAGEEKTSLTAQKDSLMASVAEKGRALIDSILAHDGIPAEIKELCRKAETLLEKLG